MDSIDQPVREERLDCTTKSAPVLDCRQLEKRFESMVAVRNLSFTLNRGSITGLMGPNGAGKSTVLGLIAGTLKPDRGEVYLRGRRTDGAAPWKVARLGLGRLFQQPRVFPRLSVLDNVLVAYPGQVGDDPFGALLRPRTVGRQELKNGKAARELLNSLGLGQHLESPARAISFGQQRLLTLAQVFAAGAEVLLLDEPMAGLDRSAAQRVRSRLGGFRDEGGTILLVEHDIVTLQALADRILFMAEGKLLKSGSATRILADRDVR